MKSNSATISRVRVFMFSDLNTAKRVERAGKLWGGKPNPGSRSGPGRSEMSYWSRDCPQLLPS